MTQGIQVNNLQNSPVSTQDLTISQTVASAAQPETSTIQSSDEPRSYSQMIMDGFWYIVGSIKSILCCLCRGSEESTGSSVPPASDPPKPSRMRRTLNSFRPRPPPASSSVPPPASNSEPTASNPARPNALVRAWHKVTKHLPTVPVPPPTNSEVVPS